MTRTKLKTNISIALLSAIALTAMMTMSIAIIPSAPYLKYEPSGAILLICGLLFGPAAGVTACAVKDLLYFLVHGGNPLGVLGDFLAMACFVFTASRLTPKGARILRIFSACAVALAATVAVMIPSNYVILYLEFGMSPAVVTATLPVLCVYNALKCTLNSVIGVYLFRVIEKVLPL